MIWRFFYEGIQARNPLYLPIPIIEYLLGYDASDGYLTFPLSWSETKADILKHALDFIVYRDELPIKTNIHLSFVTQMQDIDPQYGEYSTDLRYLLEGADDPEVTFEFFAPPEFEITPTSCMGSLSSIMPLSISRVNSSILAGVYYFDFIIKMQDERLS